MWLGKESTLGTHRKGFWKENFKTEKEKDHQNPLLGGTKAGRDLMCFCNN